MFIAVGNPAYSQTTAPFPYNRFPSQNLASQQNPAPQQNPAAQQNPAPQQNPALGDPVVVPYHGYEQNPPHVNSGFVIYPDYQQNPVAQQNLVPPQSSGSQQYIYYTPGSVQYYAPPPTFQPYSAYPTYDPKAFTVPDNKC